MTKHILTGILFLLLSLAAMAQTQSQCPFNAVNCAYGCGRHIDTNNDGYCDHSILDLPEKTNLQPKDTVIVDTARAVPGTTAKQEPRSVVKPAKPVNNPPSSSVSPDKLEAKEQTQAESVEIVQQEPEKTIVRPKKIYDLIEVSLLTFVLYFTTFFLSKRKIIRRVVHCRIWNVLLLLTFIVSCLFGFWLVVMINYQIAMSTFRTLLYWHVEIGIAMTLISVFHILWHLTYFKNIFRASKAKIC